MRHPFAASTLALALSLAGAADARAAFSLVGLNVYSANSQGGVTNPGFRYTSNSSDPAASFMFVTPTTNPGATQTQGLSFALATGANTFTFRPNNGFGLLEPRGGISLFFNATGESYNPADHPHAGDLAAFARVDGAGLSTPAAGTSILDFGPGGGTASYGGATSFVLGTQQVTISAFSIDANASGSFTLTVSNLQTVPEPSSLALSGVAGLGLLGAWLRRPKS